MYAQDPYSIAKPTLQHRIKQTETKRFITNNNKLKSVKFMTTTAQLLEHSLLVIWNDRNEDRRLEEMKKTYA